MEFPIEIQKLINDYAKPITRLDWRKGSYLNRFKYTEDVKYFDEIMTNNEEGYFVNLIEEELDIVLFYINYYRKKI